MWRYQLEDVVQELQSWIKKKEEDTERKRGQLNRKKMITEEIKECGRDVFVSDSYEHE